MSAIDREKLRAAVVQQRDGFRNAEQDARAERDWVLTDRWRYMASAQDNVLALIDAAPALPAGLPDVESLTEALNAVRGGAHTPLANRHDAKLLRSALEGSATPPKPSSYVEVHTSACHAGSDGDCDWSECPQKVEYRVSCPLLEVATPGWTRAGSATLPDGGAA